MTDLDDIKGFILDLDGVIYSGNAPIPGAAGFLAHLRESGRKYVFATNHTVHTTAGIVTKLRRVGVTATEDQVITASSVVITFLEAQSHEPPARINLVAQGGIVNDLSAWGAVLTTNRPGYVVVGWDPGCDYEALRQACINVRDGARLVVTSPDRAIPSERGWELGMGALGAAVEYATGVTATYVGKPHAAMIDLALQRLDLPRSQVAIIGDTLETDIRTRSLNGLGASVLVLSGNATADDAKQVAPEDQPTVIVPSVAELIAAIT